MMSTTASGADGNLNDMEKRYIAIREEARRMAGLPPEIKTNPPSTRIKAPQPAPKPELEEIINEPKEKQPVSILITAYKSQNFIEECLDSIENQEYFKNNDNYEILLGVDACEETLNKVKSIAGKYRNLKVYMMKKNKGPYVTLNTLLDLVKYENIIRFDSDDVMKPEMVQEIMRYSNNFNVIRFQFDDFTHNINFVTRKAYMRAFGTIFYKKYVIDSAGGYRDWRCSGDFELLKRISGRIKLKELTDSLFYRRDHQESLSNKEETGLGSQLRRKYNKEVRNYNQDEDIKIKRIVNEYEIIPFYSKFAGGINRMLKIAVELPHDKIRTSGGVRETIKFGNLISPNVIVRFQKLQNEYPENIINRWTVGMPDNTFPECDICITYSDNPYLNKLCELSQVKRVFIYMLSYGMSLDRERKNIHHPKVEILCTTKKLEKLISNEGVKVNRIGFALDMSDMYIQQPFKPRDNYLAIFYHPADGKKYNIAVSVANKLYKDKKIDGVISFGTNEHYSKFSHPKGLIKHYSNASREEVREIFNECKCFLMPSISEGLNLTPIEATLCGCPSIICDGAIDEIFFHEKTCLISEPNNEKMMYNFVCNILENYDKYISTFYNELYPLVKEHTWDSVVNNFNQILMNVK